MSDQEYQSVEQRLEALEQRADTSEQSAADERRQRDESSQQSGESLPVTMVRREDQGVAEVGVTVDGAFLPLASIKLGHVDARVQLAREQADEQRQSDRQ